MNLAHLKYAVEVEKTGSITKAADNLFMGQPNLSKAIKELEQQIGISIFRRTSRGVAPTQKGEEFLAYAKAILAQIEEMESIYRPNQQKSSFHMVVPKTGYLSHAFAQFINELGFQSETEISLKETGTLDAIAGVAEAESTMGIIRYALSQEAFYKKQLEEKGLCGQVLWEFDLQILFSQKHPLAEKQLLAPEELKNYIELVPGDLESAKPMALADVRRAQAEQKEKKSISVYERGSQLELLAEAPAVYLWAAPMPGAMLERYGLAQRKCQGATRYRDMLIYQKGYKQSQLEQAFLEKVRAVQSQIAPEE